jgi:hypothetical protein
MSSGDSAESVRCPAGVTAVATLLLLRVLLAAGIVWIIWSVFSGDTLQAAADLQRIRIAMATLPISNLPAVAFALGLFRLREWARLGTIVYMILNILITLFAMVTEGTANLGGSLLGAVLALWCVGYLCSDSVSWHFREGTASAARIAIGAAILAGAVQLAALVALAPAFQVP